LRVNERTLIEKEFIEQNTVTRLTTRLTTNEGQKKIAFYYHMLFNQINITFMK
jgi:hypothetical protein